jgi:signal transduction histidine kinase
MTDNFRDTTTRRSIALEARDVEALRETLDQLRLEVAELRASRERLVLAADTDRRRIERELHEGVQQRLVALAVDLQLAGPLADADPAAAKALLEEMGRDVQQALDEAGRLAQRIYPPLLEAGGLAAALRSAAANAGVRASIEVAADVSCPLEISWTIYSCWFEALEHGGTHASVTLRNKGGGLSFEIVDDRARPEAEFDLQRDRVEALGGRLTVQSKPGDGTRITGSLPLPR